MRTRPARGLPARARKRTGEPWAKACLDRLEQKRAELAASKRPAGPTSPERVPAAKVVRGTP
eukprot:gene6533-3398_t